MNKSFLSIGTNVGNKFENIQNAIFFIKNNEIKIIKISSIYRSEPIGYKKQSDFYNVVVKISTQMNVIDLFKTLKNIEKRMGRNFALPRSYPRVIDIDILTFGRNIIKNKILTIPHLKLHKRKFVLLPWHEISKKFIVPQYNKDVSTLLNDVKDSSKICKLNVEQYEETLSYNN